jgi:hypothetical protein
MRHDRLRSFQARTLSPAGPRRRGSGHAACRPIENPRPVSRRGLWNSFDDDNIASDLPDVASYFWRLIFGKLFLESLPACRHRNLRRGINRLRGLWPGSNRLNLRLRRGWCYLGADGVRGLRGRRIIDDPLALNMRLIPGAVIDDQHGKQADGRNNHCACERSGCSLRMISGHGIHAVSNWLS